jgi:DNA-directed RNA polymerase specialized sigma24 family protein
MTSAEEAEFITLWTAGLEIAAIAERLGIPRDTVQSRAHHPQQRGLMKLRPQGGAYPSHLANTPLTHTRAKTRAVD